MFSISYVQLLVTVYLSQVIVLTLEEITLHHLQLLPPPSHPPVFEAELTTPMTQWLHLLKSTYALLPYSIKLFPSHPTLSDLMTTCARHSSRDPHGGSNTTKAPRGVVRVSPHTAWIFKLLSPIACKLLEDQDCVLFFLQVAQSLMFCT